MLKKNIVENFYDVYGKGETKKKFTKDIEDEIEIRPTGKNGYMDHGYFSAIIFSMKIMPDLIKTCNSEILTNCVTAIFLHNSMFKFSLQKKNKDPLNINKHPLAYLLMLCDEMQCWDRTLYGRSSRGEMHPYDCKFEFSENKVKANFLYENISETNKPKINGSLLKMTGTKFLDDIDNIIDRKQWGLEFSIETTISSLKYTRKELLSRSAFMHLYNFAIDLNARWDNSVLQRKDPNESANELFEKLSLEYKISNIYQAKEFSRYLSEINCFFTDRLVDYERLEKFTPREISIIGKMEHNRWNNEKKSLGWSYDKRYTNKKYICKIIEDKDFKAENILRIRETTRTHKSVDIPYGKLSKEERQKDSEPMNTLVELLEYRDGIKIYRLN